MTSQIRSLKRSRSGEDSESVPPITKARKETKPSDVSPTEEAKPSDVSPNEEPKTEEDGGKPLVVKEKNFFEKWFLPKIVGYLAANLDSVQDIRNLGLALPSYQEEIAHTLAREDIWNRSVLRNELTSNYQLYFPMFNIP